jgi:hydrogenase maturation protease
MGDGNSMSMRIIGCGNRERGDDQAGVAVADRLREMGFDAEVHTGDALSLLERWGRDESVILIDAVVTGAAVGTVQVWRLDEANLGLPKIVKETAVSSHGFDIAKAIELGRALGKLPARMEIYGVEGSCFEREAEMSAEVRRGVEAVVEKIRARVQDARRKLSRDIGG